MRRTPVHTLEHPTPKADDLRITPISLTGWRISDRRLDGLPGISLLGFVELQNGRYEVTRFDSPSYSSTHDVLSSALAEFLSCPGGHEYLYSDSVPEALSAGAFSRVA
jgi:hypothetical protein